jgi:hypothetical protein
MCWSWTDAICARRPGIALECIGIADVARVPQNLDAGQQLNVTGRPAGCHHADAFVLIGCGVFGPVLYPVLWFHSHP